MSFRRIQAADAEAVDGDIRRAAGHVRLPGRTQRRALAVVPIRVGPELELSIDVDQPQLDHALGPIP